MKDTKIIAYASILSWFSIMIVALFIGSLLQTIGLPIFIILIAATIFSIVAGHLIQTKVFQRFTSQGHMIYPKTFRVFIFCVIILVYLYLLLIDQWSLLAVAIFMDLWLFGFALYQKRLKLHMGENSL